jgi:DNA replication protein DnaC
MNFEELLASAPDDHPPITDADKQAALAARQARVLSCEDGWYPKSLYDVQNRPLQGEKWHLAYQDALAIVRKGGIVILHGDRGPGKTRMAAEIAVKLGQGTYRTAMGFFTDVRASFKPKSQLDERDVIWSLTAPRLLVLDEIQVRGGTKFEDNLLTHLIDSRYASIRPTILIANLTRDQLAESLGASIVDRVAENGVLIHCDWGSFRGI